MYLLFCAIKDNLPLRINIQRKTPQWKTYSFKIGKNAFSWHSKPPAFKKNDESESLRKSNLTKYEINFVNNWKLKLHMNCSHRKPLFLIGPYLTANQRWSWCCIAQSVTVVWSMGQEWRQVTWESRMWSDHGCVHVDLWPLSLLFLCGLFRWIRWGWALSSLFSIICLETMFISILCSNAIYCLEIVSMKTFVVKTCIVTLKCCCLNQQDYFTEESRSYCFKTIWRYLHN